MRIQILDCFYKNDKTLPVVYLYGKTEDGELKVLKTDHYRPYFYAEGTFPDFIKFKQFILDIEEVSRYAPIGYQEEPRKMYKITLFNPKDTADVRDELIKGGMKVYEADIRYKYRYLIDHKLGGMYWTDNGLEASPKSYNAPLKSVAIDIEVLPPENNTFPRWDEDPIIIISMASSDGNIRVLSDKNEKELLLSFVDVFKELDPDVVITYNGDSFDWDYILNRCSSYDIRLPFGRDGSFVMRQQMGGEDDYIYVIRGRVSVDILPIIRKNFSLKNYKLKTAASLVNEKKIDVHPSEIRKLWEKKDKKLFEYAAQDANITLKLLLELNIIDRYIALAKTSGLLLQDVMYSGQSLMIEMLLLREFREKNRVLAIKSREKLTKIVAKDPGLTEYITGIPSDAQGEEEEIEEDEILYTGATVLDPPKGLVQNVIVLDYKSLYPTIIISHNISFDTLLLEDDPKVKYEELDEIPKGCIKRPRFVDQSVYKGIMPSILERLLKERLNAKSEMRVAENDFEKELLDAKQYALKILLNSFYGYAGYRRSRLFTLEVAASVTAHGRKNIELTRNTVRDMGYDVVYGDTDSIFVKVGSSDFKEVSEIGRKIAKTATDKLPPPMELVYEAFAPRVLFLAKKRYGMYRFESEDEGKLKTKGIETVRRDWCDYTSESLSDILFSILVEGDVNKATLIAHDAIKNIRSGEVDIRKLVLTKRLSDTYKEVSNKIIPHVVLARKMRDRGLIEYNPGDRVEFIIVKGDSSILKDDHRTMYAEKAEDPNYAIENNIPLDIEYYVEKQLIKPFMRLLSPLGISKQEVLYNIRTKKSISTNLDRWMK